MADQRVYWELYMCIAYIDGLVQERRNSSALAIELGLSCTNPSIRGSMMTTLIIL